MVRSTLFIFGYNNTVAVTFDKINVSVPLLVLRMIGDRPVWSIGK
jgi:hypothetical protein